MIFTFILYPFYVIIQYGSRILVRDHVNPVFVFLVMFTYYLVWLCHENPYDKFPYYLVQSLSVSQTLATATSRVSDREDFENY